LAFDFRGEVGHVLVVGLHPLELVEHLGGGAGFFDVIRLYPTAGVGAAVMGNATKYDIDAVARLALAFA